MYLTALHVVLVNPFAISNRTSYLIFWEKSLNSKFLLIVPRSTWVQVYRNFQCNVGKLYIAKNRKRLTLSPWVNSLNGIKFSCNLEWRAITNIIKKSNCSQLLMYLTCVLNTLYKCFYFEIRNIFCFLQRKQVDDVTDVLIIHDQLIDKFSCGSNYLYHMHRIG